VTPSLDFSPVRYPKSSDHPIAPFENCKIPLEGTFVSKENNVVCRLLIVACIFASHALCQAEMERFATVFTGRWVITDRAEPSAPFPKGFVRNGEELWHTLAGGIPLVEEYHSKGSDGKDIYDTAIVWWDRTDKKYSGLFCGQIVDQGCSPFEIAWQPGGGSSATAGQVVMTGEYRQHGKRYTWREVFVFATKTKFEQTLFIGESGHEQKPVSVISASRIGDIP
jgi:hypothetical protein